MGTLSDIFGYGDVEGKEITTVNTAWDDYLKGLDEDVLNNAVSVSLGGGDAIPFITGSQKHAQDLLAKISPITQTQKFDLQGPSLLQSISGGLTNLTNVGTGIGGLYEMLTGKKLLGEGTGLIDLLKGGGTASEAASGSGGIDLSSAVGPGTLKALMSGGGTAAGVGTGATAMAGGLPLLGSLTGAETGVGGLSLLGSLTGPETGVGGLNLLGSLTGGGEAMATASAAGGAGTAGGASASTTGAAPAAGSLGWVGPAAGMAAIAYAGYLASQAPATAPSAYRYLQAYQRGEGVPEWGISAEEVQKCDPQLFAQQLAFQGQNAASGGSDVGPSKHADYSYPGQTFSLDAPISSHDAPFSGLEPTLESGYSYTVPGEQTITNPEHLMTSAAQHGVNPSSVDIELWNQAVVTAKRASLSSPEGYVDPWGIYCQLASEQSMT